MTFAVRSVALLLLGAGVVQLLRWGTAAPLEAVRHGRGTFEDLAILAAAAGTGAVLVWIAAVLACTALAAAPGVLGRSARLLAGVVATAGARRLAQAALGLAVTAGPVAACAPATADVMASGHHPVAVAELPGVGRPGQPIPPPTADHVIANLTSDVPSGTGDVPGRSRPSPSELPAQPPEQPADPSASGHTYEPAEATQPDAGPAPASSPGSLLPEPTREPEPTEVVVKRGDSLWTVAATHLGPEATDAQIAAEWPRWYAANRSAIGPDPDLIRPGTVLVPPGPAGR